MDVMHGPSHDGSPGAGEASGSRRAARRRKLPGVTIVPPRGFPMPVPATSRRHVPWVGLLAGLAVASLASSAVAQAPRGFFTEPNLILAGPGHTAPVRSLIFTTPNGSQLLSGGMDKQIHAWNLDV